MKREHVGNLMLLLTALIWGAAFVAQSEGMKYVEPFTLQATRFALAFLMLLPVIVLRDKKQLSEHRPHSPADYRKLLLAGSLGGVCLFFGSSFQQLGLQYTTVGKSGFLTALYVVLVPLFGLFAGRKLGWRLWLSVALAVAGLYLLCIHETLQLNRGDLLTLACTLFYALQILVIDRFAVGTDGVRFSAIQFAVCAGLSAVCMLLWETPTWTALLCCWLPICYAGALSGGVGYTLQILGQQRTKPVVASLLMSMESVFAALFGWLLLNQTLQGRELLGCSLMLAAIVLAQLPGKEKQTSK